jgi:hypothetical protein
MRVLHEVSINGLAGLGYAEIIQTPDHAEECRGVIVFDEEVDAEALERAIAKKNGVYSGVVYANARVSVATFPVVIRHADCETSEPGATFVASAHPV